MTRRRGTRAGVRDRGGLDQYFVEQYRELRRIAGNLKRSDANLTINPTALVNEAWLRLSNSPEVGGVTLKHFKAIAARAMRRVLTDAARRRDARKRSGGAGMILIAPDDVSDQELAGARETLALDEALDELARLEPRQASVLEGRYFGGLTASELARLHGVSETTIERDWRVAKAFLKSRLRAH
jgi:RNA polymerase sigma factor (TIGR02999 family)